MAKQQNIFDIEVYPSFEGFPKEGTDFLNRLKRNNRREWFEKHRDEYEAHVRLPMLSLITSLQPYFARFAPGMDTNPKRALFRIYRDVRFSKDKHPYKTHVAAHFVPRGKPKGLGVAGYYLHIEPGETYLGGGIYMPESSQLRVIRKAMDNESDRFLSILEDDNFQKAFGTLEGDKLSRVPRGYPVDHPLAEYLKYKSVFVGATFSESACRKREFVAQAARVFETVSPLVQFINDALGVK